MKGEIQNPTIYTLSPTKETTLVVKSLHVDIEDEMINDVELERIYREQAEEGGEYKEFEELPLEVVSTAPS